MNLTLDETWKYCLEMWKWISEEVFVDNDVNKMKLTWLRNHNFSNLRSDCFFCDYSHNSGSHCVECPGKLVDRNFSCINGEYHFSQKPAKFYQKLVELNNIRLKGKQMNEQELNQKIEQAQKDKASIEANITELEKQKAALPKKWVAAIESNRLILNLSALSENAKRTLKDALTNNCKWISFCKDGCYGAYSSQNDGLSFYPDTKIVFGEDK